MASDRPTADDLDNLADALRNAEMEGNSAENIAVQLLLDGYRKVAVPWHPPYYTEQDGAWWQVKIKRNRTDPEIVASWNVNHVTSAKTLAENLAKQLNDQDAEEFIHD